MMITVAEREDPHNHIPAETSLLLHAGAYAPTGGAGCAGYGPTCTGSRLQRHRRMHHAWN